MSEANNGISAQRDEFRRNFAYVNRLHIDLKHCYGIKSLQADLNFEEQNAYAIYAPNGSMKTSFAKVFEDLAEGVNSKDRIFPARVCERIIADENGKPLPPSSVLVLRPYDAEFGNKEIVSTLLVNSGLRKQWDDVRKDIERAKEQLIKALKKQSGSTKNLEWEIATTFTPSEKGFFLALNRIKSEIAIEKESPLSSVVYDSIFDDKVVAVLDKSDFKNTIQGYIARYSDLLDKSTFFKKGLFEYYNASTIAKALAKNGFFDAKHTVSLNGTEKREINTPKELELLIASEKEGITNDPELKKKFAEVEKAMDGNETLRDFKTYLVKNQELLPRLANLKQLKEDLWKSYIKAQEPLYVELLAKLEAAKVREDDIKREAARERTQWEKAIDIFNDRFFVPFKLKAKNKIEAIIGEEILSADFEFVEGDEAMPIAERELLDILSQGEKKALYILNIVFEIEARRNSGQETIFIVDDIADSFDYRNKYAIIQYLNEIADWPNFRLILLTHNFDFFRVVNSRFIKRSHCLTISKTNAGIVLHEAEGVQNIFNRDWKLHFDEPRKKVASIPFIRNIVEYTQGTDHADFLRLTSLLHWKSDTANITVGELNVIFCQTFKCTNPPANDNKPVFDLITEQADVCLTIPTGGANLDHKTVLAIAIRLHAEKFMVSKIADPAFMATIRKNQTQKLVKKFIENFSGEDENIKILRNVALMTPENIHLNSFMYEPIVDMSDDHLRKLYQDVKALI